MRFPSRIVTVFVFAGLLMLTSISRAADPKAAPAPAAAPEKVAPEKAVAAEGKLAPEALPPMRDPLKPMNVVFYHVNDKLYFWVLKPVAQGYGYVVPETGRVWVRNFFSNVAMPIRCVNSTLQMNFKGAGTELARFGINTTVGVLGFGDPAASRWDIEPCDEDFGLTLGSYGVHPWIYICWPIFGPSNPRDTVGLVADHFLAPSTWLLDMPTGLAVNAYDRVNKTSLRIGEYEDFKDAAIDPYVAMRNAYYQYREKRIQGKFAPRNPATGTTETKKAE